MLDHAASQQETDTELRGVRQTRWICPLTMRHSMSSVCQFGVMFYPDRAAGYAEAFRVLKPGGTLIFNVWDRIETNEFADVVTVAVARIFPDDPHNSSRERHTGITTKISFGMNLSVAGFTAVDYESLEAISSAPSPRHPAVAYCQGTPLRNEIEARDADLLERVTDNAADAIAARFGSGPVTGRIRGHVITAVR